MRRFTRTVIGVIVVVVGLVVAPGVAQAAAGGQASAGGQAAALRDDDVVICARTAKTVTEGLDKFVATMEDVSKRATSGDLSGAQEAVKQAGATLSGLAPKLRADAEKAETPKLKDTVNKLATEFDKLGKSLSDLSSLETFDTAKLDGLADTMSDICGPTSSPTPFPAPTVSR